jgi:hypothetical protein
MWPFSKQPSIRSLLEKIMSTSITNTQALADLQAAVSANAAAITQLGVDLNAFIAKIPASAGVDPTAVETVVASIAAATTAAQALDATVNPPAASSGASASAAAIKPRTS